MIIQNGTIEFKKRTAAEINPETGYRSQPSAVTWGGAVPCQFKAVKFNQLASSSVGGEHFTQASYEVYVEEDAETPSEQVRLKDLTGRVVGEYSVIQIEPLEAVCEKRITV